MKRPVGHSRREIPFVAGDVQITKACRAECRSGLSDKAFALEASSRGFRRRKTLHRAPQNRLSLFC